MVLERGARYVSRNLHQVPTSKKIGKPNNLRLWEQKKTKIGQDHLCRREEKDHHCRREKDIDLSTSLITELLHVDVAVC
jgi:hypothetical protein